MTCDQLLRCKTPAGVEKEILMFVIVYNLVRSAMLTEAQRRAVPPDRISFIDTLRTLAWPIRCADSPLLINPLRPGRFEPRLCKRRPKKYSPMREPRAVLKERLMMAWSA